MSIYGEFFIAAELLPDIPTEVIDILKWLCGQSENKSFGLTADTSVFSWGMLSIVQSYSFSRTNSTQLIYEDTTTTYHLTAKTIWANHSSEVERFIYWIAPYILTLTDEEFLGYFRHKEGGFPTLIYLNSAKKPFFVDVTEESRREITPERWRQ